jgi:hypothetical protein
MTEKKKPADLTTDEAIRKLFPVKAVREAKKRAGQEAPEGEKPQVSEGVDESIPEE